MYLFEFIPQFTRSKKSPAESRGWFGALYWRRLSAFANVKHVNHAAVAVCFAKQVSLPIRHSDTHHVPFGAFVSTV
jgi:ATP sulfurylase